MTDDAARGVLERVTSRFGLGSVLGEPERLQQAWSNDVFRVRTGSGTYAVKLFAHDLGTALRTGTAVERAALGTGEIPMAAPVTDPESGSWLAQVETPAGSRWARCHVWIEGIACTATPPTVAIARDVGRTLAVLHRLRVPGSDTRVLDPVDLDRWHRAVEASGRAGKAWAGELAALTPLVEDLAGGVDVLRSERRPMRTSHRDLDPKNAVVRPDGRVAITDWDYAGPVLAEVELVVAAVSFGGGVLAPEEDLVTELVSAYRAAGGDATTPDDLAMRSECAGDVEWLLRTVDASLAEDAPDAAGRERSAAELVGSFAAGVDAAVRWAGRVRRGITAGND